MYCRECGEGDLKFVPKPGDKCKKCGGMSFGHNRKKLHHGNPSKRDVSEKPEFMSDNKDELLSSRNFHIHPHASPTERWVGRVEVNPSRGR